MMKTKAKSSSKIVLSPFLCFCFLTSLVCLLFGMNTIYLSSSSSDKKIAVSDKSNVILNNIKYNQSFARFEAIGGVKLFDSGIVNPAQNSKNAYVTLISGINKSLKYRGFLYNAIIMKKALLKLGSTADFIALIGFSSETDESRTTEIYKNDINLLKTHNIIVYVLPRLVDSSKLTFAEMALLKITPYSFTQYNRLQYLDGDVLPTRNMDCFFNIKYNTFTVGAVSPLNSGWFLAVPDINVFLYLKRKALWRLGCDWDEILGWKEDLKKFDLNYRGGRKQCAKWNFNGADMDQGLFTHYFILNYGRTFLIDTDLHNVRFFEKGLKYEHDNSRNNMVIEQNLLDTCFVPTSFFIHFTGRSKPWLSDNKLNGGSNRRYPNLELWMGLLDELKLPINSTSLQLLNLGSPLGYFNADMNKKKHEKCIVVD